ncbi:MAG TPA: ThuA domain-containing protein [Cyclobacteriaceae bacterium]|nr:ThuA domain-containing protein [Cyclobacteriaceae bacterium]
MKIFLTKLLLILTVLSPAYAQRHQFEVLVFSAPDLYHDAVMPTAITELKNLAEIHYFRMTWTQQGSDFNDENLNKYAVIIFLNAKGSRLAPAELASFKKFIQRGGGFVGIHVASSNADCDEWYRKLVGRTFTGHPEIQTGIMKVADKNFPATMHLPDHWVWSDEWYEFGEALTSSMHVLLTVDESTYQVKRKSGNIEYNGMGEFHPISWYQEYDGGRSFYTALGHKEAHFRDPWFLKHIYGGIYWAATGKGVIK